MTYFDYPSNLTDMNKTLHYVDTVTEHMFGVSVLMIVFCIAFFALKSRYPTESALPSSMFTTTLISILLWLLEVLPADVPPILALITAFTVVLAFRNGGGGE